MCDEAPCVRADATPAGREKDRVSSSSVVEALLASVGDLMGEPRPASGPSVEVVPGCDDEEAVSSERGGVGEGHSGEVEGAVEANVS